MVVEQSVLCQPNRLSHSGEIDPAAPAHIADEIPSTAVSHIIQYLEDHDACALNVGLPWQISGSATICRPNSIRPLGCNVRRRLEPLFIDLTLWDCGSCFKQVRMA